MGAGLSGNQKYGYMFYGHREPAWHSLGDVSQEPLGAVQAINRVGGNIRFIKAPSYALIDDRKIATGDYTLTRTPIPSDNEYRFFGYVKEGYQIIQPIEIGELFDQYVGEPVETFGLLGVKENQGQQMFLTWELEGFKVNGSDEVKMYAFLAVGYDGLYGVNLNVVSVRVVCQNTWRMAQSEAERKGMKSKGLGRVWSGRHNSPNIQRDLALWMEHVQDQARTDSMTARDQFQTIANMAVNKDQAYQMLFNIYPDPKPVKKNMPKIIYQEKMETWTKNAEYVQRDRELVMDLFGGNGTAIDATGWGLFNAVTEAENYARMTKKPANKSIMMGSRSETMNRAMSVIYDYATLEK